MLKQSGLDFLDEASDDLPEDIPWGHLYTDEEWLAFKNPSPLIDWNSPPYAGKNYIHTLTSGAYSDTMIGQVKQEIDHKGHMHIEIMTGSVKWGKFFQELDLPHQDGVQSVERSIQLETPELGNMHQRMRIDIDKMLKRDRAPIAGPDTKPINKRKRKK